MTSAKVPPPRLPRAGLDVDRTNAGWELALRNLAKGDRTWQRHSRSDSARGVSRPLLGWSRIDEIGVDVLRLVQSFVEAAFGHQRVVVAHLCNASVLEDQYSIRNRGNEIHVMTDHDARAILRIAADHADQPRPLVGVEVFSRLVEQ